MKLVVSELPGDGLLADGLAPSGLGHGAAGDVKVLREERRGRPRPSKCLQHHKQRWCKILWTGVNLLLYHVLSLIDFLFQILRTFLVRVQ